MMKLEKKNGASFDLIKQWAINDCTQTDVQTVKCAHPFDNLGE